MAMDHGRQIAALRAAIDLHIQPARRMHPSEWVAVRTQIACSYHEFLHLFSEPGRTESLVLSIGPVTDQSDTPTEGTAMQITDSQEFTYTVVTADAEGQPTGDSLVWVEDSNGAVVTLTPSEDTKSCVVTAKGIGTASGSVTDNSVTPALSASFIVDVVVGGTTTITLNAGAPTDIPAAPVAPPAEVPPAAPSA